MSHESHRTHSTTPKTPVSFARMTEHCLSLYVVWHMKIFNAFFFLNSFKLHHIFTVEHVFVVLRVTVVESSPNWAVMFVCHIWELRSLPIGIMRWRGKKQNDRFEWEGGKNPPPWEVKVYFKMLCYPTPPPPVLFLSLSLSGPSVAAGAKPTVISM